MQRSRKLALLALALPLALPFIGTAPAWADTSTNANLRPVPLNGSAGSGTAMVGVDGTTINFSLAASGLADGAHAAHIHFAEEARHECPNASADTDGDNRLSTSEGQPAYGPIMVSLTKTGDTSDKSGLAVDRFASGTDIQYMRGDVTVSMGVAQAITNGQAVVVVHGVEYTDARADAKSDLEPSLPASATDPALCGILSAAPGGGVATGAGGAADTQSAALLATGAALVVAAAGVGAAAARRAQG